MDPRRVMSSSLVPLRTHRVGGRCMMSELKRPLVGVVWKLGEGGSSSVVFSGIGRGNNFISIFNLIIVGKSSSSELSGVDQRCGIHSVRSPGCKGGVREPLSGIAVTMFATEQPREDEHYLAR
ncbi:hypothetical protein TNCV_1157091 [Trichonephila clavipes]|nr:hypothetical protein TNCV_1157091 [Trichonephila clavipes]